VSRMDRRAMGFAMVVFREVTVVVRRPQETPSPRLRGEGWGEGPIATPYNVFKYSSSASFSAAGRVVP
jgi:hypothetical protein